MLNIALFNQSSEHCKFYIHYDCLLILPSRKLTTSLCLEEASVPSRFVKMAFEADNSFILFEVFKYPSNIKCIVNNKIGP